MDEKAEKPPTFSSLSVIFCSKMFKTRWSELSEEERAMVTADTTMDEIRRWMPSLLRN